MTTSNSPELTIRSYTATEARGILDQDLVPLWEAIYGSMAADDPFFSTPRFLSRFEGYSSAPGFALRVAARGSQQPLIGMAFGYTLQPGARWWSGLETSEPEGFTDEDGHRTFAINEIMVVEHERRRGVATTLHRHLLAGRPESRATLLVEPENSPALDAYLSWGWQPVGTLKPFPDSPTYQSMILPLPLAG